MKDPKARLVKAQRQRRELQAALQELEIEVGRAFLAIPGVRWLMKRLHLAPKSKYADGPTIHRNLVRAAEHMAENTLTAEEAADKFLRMHRRP